MKKFFTLCLLLVNIGLCCAQYHKMSPLVRQAASIVSADKLWSTPTPTLPGLTGKDVVVGVVDAGIDF